MKIVDARRLRGAETEECLCDVLDRAIASGDSEAIMQASDELARYGSQPSTDTDCHEDRSEEA